MEILFIICLLIIMYAYVGYPILLSLLNKANNKPIEPKTEILNVYPKIAFVVPGYNEGDFLKQKIENTLALDYPKGRLQIIFITDGSTDHPENILKDYPEIMHLHRDQRQGKTAAMVRAMSYVDSAITIFTDANALVNPEALKVIAEKFQDSNVGVVAGEKRIQQGKNLNGSTTGESAYWKYESKMKTMDSEFNTVVGAAGELFALRTGLFEDIGKKWILDDFMLSLRINLRGFKTEYAPNAYAIETAAPSIAEEYKRKVRIAAGGWQSMIDLFQDKRLYRYPKLIFQLLSRRAVRWMVAPALLPIIFVLNLLLVVNTDHPIYMVMMVGQVLFYVLSIVGYLKSSQDKMHFAFKIPFYFSFMHYAALMGMFKYFRGQQTVVWEKAKRLQPGEMTAG